MHEKPGKGMKNYGQARLPERTHATTTCRDAWGSPRHQRLHRHWTVAGITIHSRVCIQFCGQGRVVRRSAGVCVHAKGTKGMQAAVGIMSGVRVQY